MKTILFIILFCGLAYSQQADTLKLSNGLPLLLNNGQAILFPGDIFTPPTPGNGRWITGSNGRKLKFNNGKAILTRTEE